ncbi:PH domain-containing protein [Gryllotalpicola ginsengisoli]|uniref:PH domain-containing protein n=1 Tax=Gryllotalpicola ginsengisoli TaxID=444608 RepID=UPI0003B549C9|nr:PH domain-containing protein [Gryllotalpicola ginsengisoli]
MDPLADGQWHRMHPATPLLRGGIVLVALVGIVVANLRERILDALVRMPNDFRQGDPVDEIVRHGWTLWALLGVLVFVALVVVFYRIAWQTTTFRVTREAVELRSGVLNKQSRQARLDRVQGVNVHRTLFARLFGAARLEIVVAGHDANLTLQYLSSAPAEELRREILGLARATHGDAGLHSPAAPASRPAEDRAAPASRPAETGAAPASRPADGAGFDTRPAGATQPAEGEEAAGRLARRANGDQAALDAILQSRVDEFLTPADLHPDLAPPESVVKVHPGRLIGSIVLSPYTLIVLAIVAWLVVEASLGNYVVLFAIIPSVFGFVTAYTRRFSRLARYTISGSPEGVRVGYGLLGTSSETIPAGRVHAVELVQPLMWRPFGWWTIRINRAGRARQRGQAENASVVLPVGDLADVQRVLPLLLHGSDRERLAELVAAATGRPRDAGAKNTYFSHPPASAAWLHPFSWRRIGYAFAADAVLLRRGVLARALVIVPLARVQSVALHQGPLRRILGLASLVVHVVDGRVRPRLPVLAAAEAPALFERVARSAVLLASRDVRG